MAMVRYIVAMLLASLITGTLVVSSPDQETKTSSHTDDGLVLFREQVRPLLVAKCLECHHRQRQDGGLDLSSRAGALAGGESGPAIVPGEPEQSLTYQLVTAFEMPPDLSNLLSPVETAALSGWIELGAPYEGEPLTLGEPQQSGSALMPGESMMCPCMKMMMDAMSGTKSSSVAEATLPLATPLTKEQAGQRAGDYLNSLGNPNLQTRQVNDTALSYEVEVVTKDGSLVNWIIVDKKTGRLKTLY